MATADLCVELTNNVAIAIDAAPDGIALRICIALICEQLGCKSVQVLQQQEESAGAAAGIRVGAESAALIAQELTLRILYSSSLGGRVIGKAGSGLKELRLLGVCSRVCVCELARLHPSS